MSYLCAMIYELLIGIVIYALLFVVTMQSSRRKVVAMQERLDKVRTLQEQQQAQSQQSIAQNEAKIRELETLLKKLGDENSLLRLELEEKKATLAYNNKVAMIENEKRQQAETVIFSSDIYHRSLKQKPSCTRKPSPAYSPYSSIRLFSLSSIAIGFSERFRARNLTATSLGVSSGSFRNRSL